MNERKSKRNELKMCCIDQIDIESFTFLSKMDVINRSIKTKNYWNQRTEWRRENARKKHSKRHRQQRNNRPKKKKHIGYMSFRRECLLCGVLLRKEAKTMYKKYFCAIDRWSPFTIFILFYPFFFLIDISPHCRFSHGFS